jgi:hypothetical protein
MPFTEGRDLYEQVVERPSPHRELVYVRATRLNIGNFFYS